jgi:hypothetical protein
VVGILEYETSVAPRENKVWCRSDHEEPLVEALRRREPTAADELVATYHGRAYRLAISITGSAPDAEEAVAQETSMRVVRAAAVQMSPVLYSREATVEKLVRDIHELGDRRVAFATFPEIVVPYYAYFSFVQAPAQNIAGPEQRKLLESCWSAGRRSPYSSQIPNGPCQ